MKFSEALEQMEFGYSVRLPFWNPETRIAIQPPYGGYTCKMLIVRSDKGCVAWIPTYPELFNEDWQLYKQGEEA